MNKNIKIISLIVTICIMVFSIFCFKDKIIQDTPIRILIVKSNSMYPVLKKNDFVVICKNKSYSKNDIVTYISADNCLITHRIIEKQNDNYITKGDNNNIEDDKIVTIQDIKGKVFLIIDSKKKIIFSILFIFFLCFELYKIKKEE